MFFTFSQRNIIILLLFRALVAFPIKANAPDSITPFNLADLVEPLLPAVVSISTTPIYRNQRETQSPLEFLILLVTLAEEIILLLNIFKLMR